MLNKNTSEPATETPVTDTSQSESTQKQKTRYALISRIELNNFMSFNHATADFDENNIINLKGYNSSGKSAFIKALRVLFLNYKSNRQVRWIKTGENEFTVTAYFTDGISITKGKLKNGKSWYEMYKGDTQVFTTIDNGQLTKIVDVPDIIKKYLGFFYNDNSKLTPHFLKSREPLLLVDTTGKENYDFLNEALQGEELIHAADLAKNSRSNLTVSLTQDEQQIIATKKIYSQTSYLSDELINALTTSDANLSKEEKEIDTAHDLISNIELLNILHTSLPKLKALPASDTNQLDVYAELIEQLSGLNGLKVTPNVTPITQGYATELDTLNALISSLNEYNNIKTIPVVKQVNAVQELNQLNTAIQLSEAYKAYQDLSKTPIIELTPYEQDNLKQLSTLEAIQETVLNELNKYDNIDNQLKTDLEETKQERKEALDNLKAQGYRVYVCKNCGAVNLDSDTCPVEEV